MFWVRKLNLGKTVFFALLLLSVAGWADSFSGKVTSAGQTVTPRDVVISYDSSTRELVIEMIDRVLTVEEKKYAAVQGRGISTIQTVGSLSFPVVENGGKLTVTGDGKLWMYNVKGKDLGSVAVAKSTLRLSGSLKGAVQLQSAGQSSGTTWELACDGKVFDPMEKRPKDFPAVKVGQSEVRITAEWSTTGKPDVSVTIASQGVGSGETVSEPKVVKQLATALEQQSSFTYKVQGKERMTLSYAGGAYTLTLKTGNGPVAVTLDAKASAKLAENVRGAVEYLNMK